MQNIAQEVFNFQIYLSSEVYFFDSSVETPAGNSKSSSHGSLIVLGA